jgi:hypothetical protein
MTNNNQDVSWREEFEQQLVQLWKLYEKAKEAEITQGQSLSDAVNAYNAQIHLMETFISQELTERTRQVIDGVNDYFEGLAYMPNPQASRKKLISKLTSRFLDQEVGGEPKSHLTPPGNLDQ